jgi:hypothetical protein
MGIWTRAQPPLDLSSSPPLSSPLPTHRRSSDPNHSFPYTPEEQLSADLYRVTNEVREASLEISVFARGLGRLYTDMDHVRTYVEEQREMHRATALYGKTQRQANEVKRRPLHAKYR